MKLPKIPDSQYDQEAILKGTYYYSWRISQVVTYDMLKGWVMYPKFLKLSGAAIRMVDDFVPCDRNGTPLASMPVTGSKCDKSNILSSIEKTKKEPPMAQLRTSDAEDFDYDTQVVTEAGARDYAAQVAKEAIEAYAARTGVTPPTNKGTTVNNEVNEAAEAVKQETLLSAKLVSGEILLDNIETIADKLVMSRLSWFQKLTINKKQKEMAVTLATYAIVHAIKTGGFGLTKYRISHAALDYVTLAANQRMVKYLVSSVGIDTNLAAMFLKAPELTTAEA